MEKTLFDLPNPGSRCDFPHKYSPLHFPFSPPLTSISRFISSRNAHKIKKNKKESLWRALNWNIRRSLLFFFLVVPERKKTNENSFPPSIFKKPFFSWRGLITAIQRMNSHISFTVQDRQKNSNSLEYVLSPFVGRGNGSGRAIKSGLQRSRELAWRGILRKEKDWNLNIRRKKKSIWFPSIPFHADWIIFEKREIVEAAFLFLFFVFFLEWPTRKQNRKRSNKSVSRIGKKEKRKRTHVVFPCIISGFFSF